jgi:hypothetical protein
MPYVEFLQDWGKCKAGEISDDLNEKVARALIETGQAKQSDHMAVLRQSMTSEFSKLRSEVLETVKGGLATPGVTTTRAVGGPPNGGGDGAELKRAIEATDVHNVKSPVDRTIEQFTRRFKLPERPLSPEQKIEQEITTKRRDNGCVGEVLRMLDFAQKPFITNDPGMVQHYTRVLRAMSIDAGEYKYDDNSGQFTYTQRRILPDGGEEVLTRTGTDSLSGGATYGFALKPEYLGNLFEISMEQQVFVNAAQGIPVTQGNEVKWPAWDQYRAPVTNSQGQIQSAVFAGIQLFYEGETSARVESDALLNMINFKVVDLTGFTALSRDFIRDNHLAFDAALTRMFGRAIGWMEDYMSIQGPGAGRPQGYFNGPSTLVVNRAASSKIRPADLTAMISNISPMVWDDLRWITNITTFPQLSILYDGSAYVFQPNALISQAMKLSMQEKSIGGRGAELMHRPMGDLLGFPVYFSEKVPTLGNTGDLSLVAPSQFGVARREGLEMGVSEHFYFSTDLTAYRFKLRHDMKPLWRATYQQADGSATQVAPFVILH